MVEDTKWFRESNLFWKGIQFSMEIQKVLHHEKSEYQDILIFKNEKFGNVLALDGVIQATEKDEFAYQEMMAHVPLHFHECPKNVLVIGGGDGGVLREVVKHSSIETVTLCEIDEAVVRLSKIYLPSMAVGFDSPKVNLVIQDGFEFLKNHVNQYDVIITDSSDPVGPAESLFQPEFFQLLKNSLRDNGIICTQAECPWLHLEYISALVKKVSPMFEDLKYGMISLPTYPCGVIGQLICRKNTLLNEVREEVVGKYYDKNIHMAALELPVFIRNEINKAKKK
jgi:spermidine synthase